MNVEVQRQDGNLIALVEGSVDGNNAAAFQSSLQGAVQEGDKSMVLDFSALDYISSAGLAGASARRQGHAEQWRQLCNLLPPGAGQGAFHSQRLRPDHPDQRLPGSSPGLIQLATPPPSPQGCPSWAPSPYSADQRSSSPTPPTMSSRGPARDLGLAPSPLHPPALYMATPPPIQKSAARLSRAALLFIPL